MNSLTRQVGRVARGWSGTVIFAKVEVGVLGIPGALTSHHGFPRPISLGPCWGRRASQLLCLPPTQRCRHPQGTPGLADSAFFLQTSGWCLSSSRSPRRSCLSTAGMAAPDSSTSECPRIPYCCAGCCKCPRLEAPRVQTWRSLCRCLSARLPEPSPGPRSDASPAIPISRYFRYGAPPVINPLGTSFPANTSVQPSFFVKMLQSNTSINVSHPAPGDWFVAAHLPPSSQKIEVKVRGLLSRDGGAGHFCAGMTGPSYLPPQGRPRLGSAAALPCPRPIPTRPRVSGPALTHAYACPPPPLILFLGLCSHLCLHLPA